MWKSTTDVSTYSEDQGEVRAGGIGHIVYVVSIVAIFALETEQHNGFACRLRFESCAYFQRLLSSGDGPWLAYLAGEGEYERAPAREYKYKIHLEVSF